MTNRNAWDTRIRRTEELLERNAGSKEVLAFYFEVLALQQKFSGSLSLHLATDAIPDATLLAQLDVDIALHQLPALLTLVLNTGPAKMAEQASRFGDAGEMEQRQTLLAFLNNDRSRSYAPYTFFSRVLFQVQAEFLASRRSLPANYSGTVCPFCGSNPQFAVLRPEGDAGKRHLSCSLCLAEWEFRRIVCPACDEMDHTKLPRYCPDEPVTVRLEACDTCKTYMKSFDMTENGLLVPDVDEMATVALDVWAGEHGYHKIQLNLLGF